MIQDPNMLAKEWERREEQRLHLQPPYPEPRPALRSPTGVLKIWSTYRQMLDGVEPVEQPGCQITLKDSGILVAYTEDDRVSQIFYLVPGQYAVFEPYREGE